MTPRFSYIGDPLSALGYALLGARRLSPDLTPDAVVEALREARDGSDLVLIENAYAALVRDHLRSVVVADPLPPIIVVPCLHKDDQLSDASVREARGVLAIS